METALLDHVPVLFLSIGNLQTRSRVMMLGLLHFWKCIVHFKLKNVLVCGHMRCVCIAAHENGMKEKYLTDWFCIRSKAKRNPKCSRSECLPADQSPEKLVCIYDMIQKGETLRLHGWLYRLETV